MLPQLQKRLQQDKVLLRLTCKNFTVHKLRGTSAAGLICYENRLEYNFPDGKGSIKMKMWFRDMESVSLQSKTRTLSFHISTGLLTFAGAYDHNDRDQMLSLQFCSSEDVQKFKDIVAKHMPPISVV